MFSGVMAYVMGIVTILRMSQNIKRKQMETNPVCVADTMLKSGGKNKPVISFMDDSYAMKRLGDLEDKVNSLRNMPAKLPLEKEEMLNASLSRMETLEAELLAAKKVPILMLTWFMFSHGSDFKIKTSDPSNRIYNYMNPRLFTVKGKKKLLK